MYVISMQVPTESRKGHQIHLELLLHTVVSHSISVPAILNLHWKLLLIPTLAVPGENGKLSLANTESYVKEYLS